MQFGTGQAFREPTRIERAAAAVRGPLAHSRLRTPLKRLYETVLDLLPGGLMSRFPDGESVRVAAGFRQVTWNLEEYRAFKADLAPGDVVFDVGANVGAYALLFAQWVGATGHVYAFEPAPDARRGLERHVRLNRAGDRVTVRGEAISAIPGTAMFRAAGPQGDNRIVAGAAAETRETIAVRTTTIDEVCRIGALCPALIKIDVEGAELDVLRGARATIAALGESLHLYVEMHPHLWPAFGVSREQIEAELARQRLVPERLDGRPDVWGIEGVCLRLRRCGS